MLSRGWRGWCIGRAATAVFPPQVGADLVEVVHQAPAQHGLARSRWRLTDLRAVVPDLAAYSVSGVSRALARLGVRRKRGRQHLHSPDPACHRKARAIRRAVTLARRHPTRVTVVYGDEMSCYRQPTLAHRYARVGEEPTADLSQRANTRHRLCGALDAVTGRVTSLSGSKIGVAKLQQFLRDLRAAYPDRCLGLVWDNWPVHAHPAVLAEATRLHIHIFWLPTYAPWLNPIEKLWRLIKQEVLHHHRLADRWDDLKAAIAAVLARFQHGSIDLLRYVGLLPK